MRNPAVPLLALLVFAAAPAAAAADELLGAPSYDHATETTWRQVSWDDFQGKGMRPPGWNRWLRGSFAHIATALRASRFEVVDFERDGRWIARAEGIRPYAIMNKDFSAVKPGTKNAYTLAHEQLHFDIAELVARRLAVELIAVEGVGSLRQEARIDLDRQLRERFEAGLRELEELQGRYDGETANGVDKKKQKKWAARVPEMFREATEALQAALEETSPPGEKSGPTGVGPTGDGTAVRAADQTRMM